MSIDQINLIAESEGWGIFICEGSQDGDYQIQKIDDKNKFKSDMDAIRHILKLAFNGSTFHKQAIWKVINLNPKEKDIIFNSIL